jgi:hypothetical protein
MSTELDHLRAFRAADATADATARDAARDRLMAAIGAAPGEAAAPGSQAAPASARPSRRTGRRLLAGLGGLVVAAAAAVAVALLSGLGGGSIQPQPATAAQLLREAASGAARQSYLPLRRGQLWYRASSEDQLFTSAVAHHRDEYAVVTLPVARQTWTAVGRQGRMVRRIGTQPRFPTAIGKRGWLASGRRWAGTAEDLTLPPAPLPVDRLMPFGQPSPQTLRRLPSDLDALYARLQDAIRDQAGHDRSRPHPATAAMWDQAVGLIAQIWAPTPPALRADLYRVLARIPGVRRLGGATDGLGRPGQLVALDLGGHREELLVDPVTGTLLEERTVLLRDQYDYTARFRRIAASRVPAGWTTRVTLVDAGAVDAPGRRP